MRRFLILVLVFVAVFAVSCSKKKSHEENDYVEQVSKEIKAEEGGTVESSDGKTSVEIPAGALDSDTTISMTIRNAIDFPSGEDEKIVSMVVEFEPSGTVFKKPVFITMPSMETVKNKVITAAVFHEDEGKWSYSESGVAVKVSQSASGDPIMTTASGDPIMLNASGDPIMMSASGDPIMLSASGDPIMTSASGDPIMNAASGDPIMMTTGHFTAYTFIVIEPKEAVEPDDTEPVDDGDTTPAETDDDEPVKPDGEEIGDIDVADNDEAVDDEDIDDNEIIDEDEDVDDVDDNEVIDEDEDIDNDNIEVVDEDTDIDTPEPDEDIIPEPEPAYSKVLCTGSTRCISENSEAFIDCPEEGADMNGQDAQYAAKKSCVPARYTKISKNPENNSDHNRVVDEVTGLTWIVDITEEKSWDNAKDFCSNLNFGGYEDWRLPTPKEVWSIAVGDSYGHAVREYYFHNFYEYNNDIWARQELPEEKESAWSFNLEEGSMQQITDASGSHYIMCVHGDEEYGKVEASDYISETVGGDEMIRDSKTGLLWQKTVEDGMTTFKDALAYCENLTYAGKNDWRLPNRNELLTLVDYSKAVPAGDDPEAETTAASSFPGMPKAVFITSTPIIGYYNPSGLWALDMETGEQFSSYLEVFSVRCVRSDMEGYPEGMTISYCDETGVAPCKDKVSGYIWSPSSMDYLPNGGYADRITFAKDCRNSVFAGNKKWRIPTIDEVRTLATNCGELKAYGECNISEACSDFSEACYDEDVCVFHEGCESDLHDYGNFLSSTASEGGAEVPALIINFKDGIFAAPEYFSDGILRCIMDETIPEVEFPYTDPETGYTWSDISPDDMDWEEMSGYCGDLGNQWRLPSVEELKTLVRNCPGGVCEFALSGKYSKFGDIETLWSSEMYLSEHFKVLDFTTASVMEDIYDAKVRCILGTGE